MSAAAAPRIGVDALLSRLDCVRQSGPASWRTTCPTGHRTRGTLSIALADNGAILLHCFAGCSAADVLAALGLTLADIQPQRLRDPSPEGRRAARAQFRLASVSAACVVLVREASIVQIAANDILRGCLLNAEDAERLAEAAERIQSAREVLV